MQTVYRFRDEGIDDGIVAQDQRSSTPGTAVTRAAVLPARMAVALVRRSATHAAPDRSFSPFPADS